MYFLAREKGPDKAECIASDVEVMTRLVHQSIMPDKIKGFEDVNAPVYVYVLVVIPVTTLASSWTELSIVLRLRWNPLCAGSSVLCLFINLVLGIFSKVLHKCDVIDIGLHVKVRYITILV